MDEKLSEQAVKFIEEINDRMSNIDVQEQNVIIKSICESLLSIRRLTLDTMDKNRNYCAEKTEMLIKILHDIS